MSWLENDIILIVYTSNSAEDNRGSTPSSSYYIVTRRKQAPFMFQKLPELCLPFGMKRSPAYQFIARLRDFKPHLTDLLVVSSTASTDIGLITRADQALSDDDSAKQTTGLYTTTEINDDTKRAEIPLTESADETSVIGLGMDLSCTENVASPIPGEEIAESATPLPNFLLLNNNGIVSSWWFVYSESVRQKVAYPGLSAVKSGAQQQQQPTLQRPLQQQSPSFGTSSPLAPPTGLGRPSATPATPAFGTPSALGSGRPSTFGTPSALGSGFSLGSSSASKPSFGTPSALSRGTPQFGQSGFGRMNQTPIFGQPSFGQSSPAPNPSGFSISGGGFGSFANSGGFAGLASSKPAESAFSKPATASSPSPFGFGTNTNTAFTSQNSTESGGLNKPSTGFVLGSTFKGDGSATNDGPLPENPSGPFSLGADVDEMISTPTKASPPVEAMDDMDEDTTETQKVQPAPQQPLPLPNEQMPTSSISGPSRPLAPATVSFGNNVKTEQSSAMEETSTEKDEDEILTPKQDKHDVLVEDQPLPPDSTSKAVFGPGDTSASSNVSKSSFDDVSFPSDLGQKPEPAANPTTEPPLPPDFTAATKKVEETRSAVAEETPLPRDPSAAYKHPTGERVPEKKVEETKPVIVEEAPLPPDPGAAYKRPTGDPVPEKKEPESVDNTTAEKPIPAEPQEDEEAETKTEAAVGDEKEETEAEGGESEGEEAGESDFAEESGDEAEEGELNVQSLKTSPESSYRGPLGKSPADWFKSEETPRSFDEAPRSPSPVKTGGKLRRPEKKVPKKKVPVERGATLAARRAALSDSAQEPFHQEPSASDIDKEEENLYIDVLRRQAAEETQLLSDDDEDERLHADLARPVEPVPTLDPFLPHQDYMGSTSKPGVPGQIEKLYRDINSMVDTLGINSRSLLSYTLYQESSNDSDYGKWTNILHGDEPTMIADEKFYLTDIEKLDDFADDLTHSLDQRRVHNAEEKLSQCRDILSNDILILRGQCAGIRKTLDAHTNTASSLSASLSAEQVNMQQDIRAASTATQARLAELEQDVSLLRAKIADASCQGGAASSGMTRPSSKRPTVEAVTSTIGTMMNMAETRSSDIDVLESQMKRLGLDISTPVASREGSSPLMTPKKAMDLYPMTPLSRDSANGSITAYHTPDSASQALNMFRYSMNGSARASRLRDVEGTNDYLIHRRATEHWRERTQRRKCLVDNLRHALETKRSQVRGVDDP